MNGVREGGWRGSVVSPGGGAAVWESHIWVLTQLCPSTWSLWLSDLGLTSGRVHPPEAITTKFDFLLCEYLFIMKLLLGWGAVRRRDVGGQWG